MLLQKSTYKHTRHEVHLPGLEMNQLYLYEQFGIHSSSGVYTFIWISEAVIEGYFNQ